MLTMTVLMFSMYYVYHNNSLIIHEMKTKLKRNKATFEGDLYHLLR